MIYQVMGFNIYDYYDFQYFNLLLLHYNDGTVDLNVCWRIKLSQDSPCQSNKFTYVHEDIDR